MYIIYMLTQPARQQNVTHYDVEGGIIIMATNYCPASRGIFRERVSFLPFQERACLILL